MRFTSRSDEVSSGAFFVAAAEVRVWEGSCESHSEAVKSAPRQGQGSRRFRDASSLLPPHTTPEHFLWTQASSMDFISSQMNR